MGMMVVVMYCTCIAFLCWNSVMSIVIITINIDPLG